MIALLVVFVLAAVALLAASGSAVWARSRTRGPAAEDDPDLRRARAETYLRALKWLDAARLVHEPLAVGNGHDPVPEELKLKRELASVHELIMLFGSAQVRALFTSFADSMEARSAGARISEADRRQIITIAKTMAEEIDGVTTPPPRHRRSRRRVTWRRSDRHLRRPQRPLRHP